MASASNSKSIYAPASSSYPYTLSVSFNETSTSTPNNTSTISCSASIGASKISYSVSSGGTLAVYWHDNNANTDKLVASITISSCGNGGGASYGTKTTSGSITATHKSDGTLSGYAKAVFTKNKSSSYIPSSNNVSTSNTTLTTIPRQANLNSAPNFNDEQNPTITYTNSAGNSVSSLQARIENTSGTALVGYRDVSKTGTSYTFNLTASERNALRSATPNSKTMNVKFVLRTILGGNTYYSTITKTLTITNANPTFDNPTYADTNATTTALTQDATIIIQNKSTLQFQFTNIASYKYATLSKVAININGIIKNLTLSGTSVASTTYDFGLVNVSDNTNATLTLIDSRGNTSVKTIPLTIWEYATPTATINVARQNNFYTESTLLVDANFSSLNGINTINIKYRIKKTTDGTWGAWTSINDNVVENFNADNQFSWDLEVQLEDILQSVKTYTINNALDVGIPLVYYDVMNRSVGVNCIPQNQSSFEIDKNLFVENVNIYGALFYRAGDTMTMSARFYCNATITSATRDVVFCVPVNKSMLFVQPTLTSIAFTGRTTTGGYLNNSTSDITNSTSGYTFTLAKTGDYFVRITCNKSSAFTNVSNNTPVAINVIYTFTFQ